jgi:hypothetical protein
MAIDFLPCFQDPLRDPSHRDRGRLQDARPVNISYTAEDNKKSPAATWPPGDFTLASFLACATLARLQALLNA